MSRRKNEGLQDDFTALNRGFSSALRSKESFLFLRDLIRFMSEHVRAVDPTAPKSDTLFLEREFKSKDLANNWKVIETLYDRGLAPIRVALVPDGKTREETEVSQLRSVIDVLFPPTGTSEDGKPRENILAFAQFFATRFIDTIDSDFAECRASLEVMCHKIASFMTKEETDLHKTDQKSSLDKREARMTALRNLFAAGKSNIVVGSSDAMKDLLKDKSRFTRVPFLAGSQVGSLDDVIKGFHAAGLVMFLGTSSSGKTLVLSSIMANHLLYALKNSQPMPHIWAYIGEDGVESYPRRILCNVMNRLASKLNISRMTLSEFGIAVADDPNIQTLAFDLQDMVLANTKFLRPPERTEDKLRFSVLSILNTWEALLDAGAEKPLYIVFDYFGLLNLPRDLARREDRPRELQQIAHLLDEWGEQRGIAIISAMQASIGGVVGAREMRFLEQEDSADSKSVFNSTRMMISMLPFEEWDTHGRITSWMGFKILKNRNGPRNKFFQLALDYETNTTLTDSKVLSESEWEELRVNILDRKAEMTGRQSASGGFGNGRGGGGGRRPPTREGRRQGGTPPAQGFGEPGASALPPPRSGGEL